MMKLVMDCHYIAKHLLLIWISCKSAGLVGGCKSIQEYQKNLPGCVSMQTFSHALRRVLPQSWLHSHLHLDRLEDRCFARRHELLPLQWTVCASVHLLACVSAETTESWNNEQQCKIQ